jgi:hypothetical protein
MKKLALILSLFLLFSSLATPALAYGTLSLSQTNVSLSAGQSVNLTAYTSSNQSVFVSSVSNTFVAYANVSGSQITIYGLGSGNTQITICTYDNSCATVSVYVSGNSGGNGGNYNGQLTFSQTNVNLTLNQSTSVTVYNSSGYSLYISNNSNANIASASVSGSTVNVTGNNSGSTTITICSNNYAQCGYLYVTVNGNNNSQIGFSQTNVNLSVNQNMIVTIYGGGSNYYVSNNTTSSVINPSISGNSLNLYALSAGNSTITVCNNNGGACGSVYVTVAGNSTSQLTFSQNNLSLNSNQSTSVSVYNSFGSLYISNNSNANVAGAYVSGSAIYVTGNNSGSATITVCGSNGGACGYLYVTVTGSTSGTVSFSQNNLNLSVNQSATVNVYNTLAYSTYLSTNSNPNVASASLSGNSLYVTGLSYGSDSIMVCSSNATQCGILYVTVGYGSGGGSVAGALTYPNGSLVNDNGTIYLTYRNTKSGFTSLAAFRQLGYNLSNVITGPTSDLVSSGYVITTANMAHPWGSWIKNGNTVYFVYATGLIPITNYDIFLSNGGQDRFVVQANSYDMARSILPVMDSNDSRLK